MGFFYKHIIQPLMAKILGKKAFTNNPYLGMIIDASDSDVIADEQFRVGMAYYEGAYMLPKDMNKALSYFRKAAERGHALAQTFMVMGCMNYNDDHNEEVMYWLQKAAEQGERQALYNLGISYHRGDLNGMVDIAKSNELFRQSAEAGYQAAYSRMAQIYFNGEGVEKNLKIAKYWAWLDFANLPEDSRDNSILMQLIEPEDVNEENHLNFKKIIEEAAEAGERDAMDNWAAGLKNTGDNEKAFALWQKAVNLKHPNSMCNVARQCWTEKVKEYKQAKALFEEASKSGNEHAFYGLAVIYYQGLGVERDVKKAWEYLEKAINKGDTESKYLFAIMCLNNDLEAILPDKVMRGMNYMEQAAMDHFQPALDFYKSNESAEYK